MLVATAIVVSFATVALSQDWWLQLRYYVESRTSKTPPAKPTSTVSTDEVIKWLIGIGGTWVILTLLVDLGDTAEIGEAFALVLMGTVLMVHGPQALTNLGVLKGSK
jgi:hypothetical protein